LATLKKQRIAINQNKRRVAALKAAALKKEKLAKQKKHNITKSRITNGQTRILKNYLVKYLVSNDKTRAALASSQINKG